MTASSTSAVSATAPRGGYLKRLVQAHHLHHATTSKEGGVSFGFVLARDPTALKAELKVQREAGAGEAARRPRGCR